VRQSVDELTCDRQLSRFQGNFTVRPGKALQKNMRKLTEQGLAG
jgi:hypothetical protein